MHVEIFAKGKYKSSQITVCNVEKVKYVKSSFEFDFDVELFKPDEVIEITDDKDFKDLSIKFREYTFYGSDKTVTISGSDIVYLSWFNDA